MRQAFLLALIAVAAGPGCRVSPISTPLGVDERAPEFSLPDQEGRQVTLESLLGSGPAVLVFHRGHGSAIARHQLDELARNQARFDALGASVVAISADPPEEAAALASDLGVRFPLLSDPDRRAISAYGVADSEAQIAVPAVYVVAADETIVFRAVGLEATDIPSVDAVVEATRAARSPEAGD